MAIRTDRGDYLLTGANANGSTGVNYIDARGMSDKALVIYSSSGNGPTAGGCSAIVELLHSHDLTAWTVVARYTSLRTTAATAVVTTGPFSYLRAQAVLVYSAAQTGTAFASMFVRPGMV